MTGDARSSLPPTIERMALAIRYISYAFVMFLVSTQLIDSRILDVVLLSAVFLLHQIFVHAVLWLRRYDLFRTRLNFAVNFVEVFLIVFLTGPDTSAAYLLYFPFLIGFSAYERRFRRVMYVTLLCAASYTFAIAFEEYLYSVTEPYGILIIKVLYILFAGWLMAVMSDRLRSVEEALSGQAASLASSEAMLRTILNSAGDPILVYDDNEFIAEANARASEFLRVPREKLVGQRIRAFLFDDGTLSHKFANLRVRGEMQSEEVFVSADGEERVVEVVSRSFIRNHARYYVAIIRDVTDRKNLQEATRLANVQLERLNSELRQVGKLKTGFLTSISQNMRSPLSAVSGYLEMLLEEELGEINADQRKALQTCRRGLLRVFKLIDEALDLHRLETKRSNLIPAREQNHSEHPDN
ncbi:MAG: PAS domain S-box protein [Candidatus Hydrogenedentes bacterium]|nr:PAS domain S-box protein [Candidatus Hydrogenedentota bacterium]